MRGDVRFGLRRFGTERADEGPRRSPASSAVSSSGIVGGTRWGGMKSSAKRREYRGLCCSARWFMSSSSSRLEYLGGSDGL